MAVQRDAVVRLKPCKQSRAGALESTASVYRVGQPAGPVQTAMPGVPCCKETHGAGLLQMQELLQRDAVVGRQNQAGARAGNYQRHTHAQTSYDIVQARRYGTAAMLLEHVIQNNERTDVLCE